MKMAALSMGVKVPAWCVIDSEEDAVACAASLSYPLLVKHPTSHCSWGLTKQSRVENEEQLRTQVRGMLSMAGSAIIDEFIDGTEITCLVAENGRDASNPVVLCPFMCQFPEGESFKYYQLKWETYEGIKWIPIEDKTLSDEIKEASKRVFVAFHGHAFGRCDFRFSSRDGCLYFLEINSNCGIFYPPNAYGSADFIIQHDGGHRAFVMHVIDTAIELHRQKGLRDVARVRFTKARGHGLFATRDLDPGTVIVHGEGSARCLASKGFVESRWSLAEREKLFLDQSQPMGHDVFAIPSANPDEWRPLNHSCDPNAWYAGAGSLNVVARRRIKKGEEITVEYATVYGEFVKEFACRCGCPSCRLNIRPSDCRSAEIMLLYRDHMSPFVDWEP